MNEKIMSAAAPLNPSRPVYRRRFRNILIHKPMQREFSMVLIALLMVSTLAVGFVIHGSIREMALAGYHFGKISPYEFLSDMSYQLVVRVSSILFATLVIIAIYGVFFLHRVAGPVYRFRQTFLRLNDGEIPHPIRLREGDFFGETAGEINLLIKRMRFDKEKIKRAKDKLIQAAADSANPKLVQEIKTILDEEPSE